jgi:glycine cleavage system H protein
MSNVPSELRYTRTHEWAQMNDDGTITVGITDHAQRQMGDLVFVELPETAHTCSDGDEIAVVESVKAASDVYVPISGEVIEVNTALQDTPALVNTDSYGAGWILKLRPEDEQDFYELMDAENYQDFIESE